MMSRKINIDDRVICKGSGVVGKVLRFYVPTACGEQTMVLTDDGREYHAPTNHWVKEPINVTDFRYGGVSSEELCSALSEFSKALSEEELYKVHPIIKIDYIADKSKDITYEDIKN